MASKFGLCWDIQSQKCPVNLKLILKQKKAALIHVGTNDIHYLDPGQMVI